MRSDVSLFRRRWLPLPVHIWSHSPTQPMHEMYNETMKLQIDHNTGNYIPYSFRQVCRFFNVPCWPCTLKMQETGPEIYSPYPRRLECQTICWYNYKGSTFFSVILRPRVLVRSGARTIDLPHSRLALYQWSRQASVLQERAAGQAPSCVPASSMCIRGTKYESFCERFSYLHYT